MVSASSCSYCFCCCILSSKCLTDYKTKILLTVISCTHLACCHCALNGNSIKSLNEDIIGVIFTTREAACIYSFSRVCLSDDNFRKPGSSKFIFTQVVYLNRVRVKFVYETHRVRVWIKISYSNLIGNNSSSVKHRAMKFAFSMGFSAVMDQWCYRHLCHVTGSEHT